MTDISTDVHYYITHTNVKYEKWHTDKCWM